MKAKIFNQSCWLFDIHSLDVNKEIEQILVNSNFEILKNIEHEFIPVGFTKIWLLGESHLAIHTFPEEKVLYVELSSCSEEKFNLFWMLIQKWSNINSKKIDMKQKNYYEPF